MAGSSSDYPALRVRVLGSGTSSGIPVIGCTCAVCASDDPRDNRLRASLKIEAGETMIVIDCGTDFRQQMLRWPVDSLDAVLITHTHADHIHGLDDLRAFTFRRRGAIPIYSTAPFLDEIRTKFAYCFNPTQKGGGVPKLELREVKPGEAFEVGGLSILPIKIMHGDLPILAYRFGRFAYATDCSAIPLGSRRHFEGVKTLILSALRQDPHPTHFSIDQALEAARSIGVERVYFIHMAHTVGHAETEAGLPEWARLTYDGMELTVA